MPVDQGFDLIRREMVLEIIDREKQRPVSPDHHAIGPLGQHPRRGFRLPVGPLDLGLMRRADQMPDRRPDHDDQEQAGPDNEFGFASHRSMLAANDVLVYQLLTHVRPELALWT